MLRDEGDKFAMLKLKIDGFRNRLANILFGLLWLDPVVLISFFITALLIAFGKSAMRRHNQKNIKQ